MKLSPIQSKNERNGRSATTIKRLVNDISTEVIKEEEEEEITFNEGDIQDPKVRSLEQS